MSKGLQSLLWLLATFWVIVAIKSMILIFEGKYPRTTTFTMKDDILGFLITTGLILWLVWSVL